MKKKYLTLTVVTLLSGCFLFSSCIGSFNASKKILAWNQTIDTKFVNEIVFVALWIVPVYPVSILADLFVLNSIEFWTGENPIEAGVVKKVQGENGVYTVETLENGYHIQNEEGENVDLIYDKESNTWSAVANGESTKLIKIKDDKNAVVYLPDGKEMNVNISANGVLAFRQAVMQSAFFAVK